MIRLLTVAAAVSLLLTSGALADEHAYYIDDPLYEIGAPDMDYTPTTTVDGADTPVMPPTDIANAFAKLRAEDTGIRSEGWDPDGQADMHSTAMPGDRTSEERVNSARQRSMLNDSSHPGSGDDPTSVNRDGHETGLPTHPMHD